MPEEKLQIVEEMLAPGAIPKQVAERHEISTGLLFTWRRQLMTSAASTFLPVQVTWDTEAAPAAQFPPPLGETGMIEVDMPSGVRVRVGHGVNLKVLRGVLAALEGR